MGKVSPAGRACRGEAVTHLGVARAVVEAHVEVSEHAGAAAYLR